MRLITFEDEAAAPPRPAPPPPANEITRRRRANREIVKLTTIYHPAIPLGEIEQILEEHGFELPEIGLLCGRDGRLHERVGKNTWLVVTWHKMEVSGRYEIVSYLS